MGSATRKLLPICFMSTYLVTVLLASIGLLVWKGSSSIPTFPGPRPIPILGNALQMPKTRPWLTFAKWAKEYGDCVYLRVLGQPILIIHSFQTANELLEQRSLIYSDRPTLPMASNLCGFDQSMPMMSYTPTFRQIRQILKKELTTSSLKEYWPFHEQESRKLVNKLLSNPTELFGYTQHYAASLILRAVYGYMVTSEDDPYFHLSRKVIRSFSEACQPGYWAVDIFPWLRYIPAWMPGAGFKRKAAEWYKLHIESTVLPYEWTKSNLGSPYISTPNVVSNILSHADTWSNDEDFFLLWGASALFGGGADTNVSIILSFYLAMALHPDIQVEAQKEIDNVLKGKRLPRVEDADSLPFVQNIVREVLRWNPVAPMGLPHNLTQDDVYRNFKLPKGTIVIPNVWSMLHDPEVYPEPERFNPTRFAGNQAATKTLYAIFGFGRRACPGMIFAEVSIFISIATALAVCTISDAVDEKGQKMSCDLVYTSDAISHPPKFKCKIQSRSSAAMDLLRREI